MNTIPQITAEPPIPAPRRSTSVVMGSQDFLSVLFRSISAELYKIRRRLMSKILLIVAIPIMIIIFGFAALPAIIAIGTPTTAYLQSCTNTSNFSSGGNTPPGAPAGTAPCQQTPTQAEINQAQQYKQNLVTQFSAPLRLPGSLTTSVGIIDYVGLIILIILAATIVGGEYSVGTIRLLLTRGPTRTQYFLAKIGAILISIIAVLLVLTIVGIITGALLNLITGIAIDTGFLTGTWILHAVLYLLIATLGLFVYTMLALCLCTLGRATAAGLAVALVWWFLEGVIGTILTLIGTLNKGALADTLKAIPDYFIGNNIAALLDNQRQYLTGGQGSAISDGHALLVLAVYLIVFIGGAWWVHHRRDVTN